MKVDENAWTCSTHEDENAYTSCSRNVTKRPLGSPRRRRGDNIKINRN